MYPVNYIGITQLYNGTSHYGLDLGWSSTYGGANAPIYASESGTVIAVRTDVQTSTPNNRIYGNYIKIKHNDEVSTLYAHLKYGSINLKVGDVVNKGDQIGLMGNTGYSFGNHLHYEVYINNNKVNPIDYTYVYSNQVVDNSDLDKVLYYKEESNSDEISVLENKIKELEKLVEELKTFSFKYEVEKTNLYKIQLYEGETIYVK